MGQHVNGPFLSQFPKKGQLPGIGLNNAGTPRKALPVRRTPCHCGRSRRHRNGRRRSLRKTDHSVEVPCLEPQFGAVHLDRYDFNTHQRNLPRQLSQTVDFFLQAFQFGLFSTEDVVAERPLSGVVANSCRFFDKSGRFQMLGGFQKMLDVLIEFVLVQADRRAHFCRGARPGLFGQPADDQQQCHAN